MPLAEQAAEKRRIQTIVRQAGFRGEDKILDVGCGTGWLAQEIAQRGPSVYALDLSRDGVQGAKRMSPASITFLLGDVYDLPFSDAKLDGVILSEIVEHLEKPSAAFAEVHRVLKPAGKVIITVPYKEKIRWYLCIHCNQLTPANAHVHSFDGRDLSELLDTIGFRVIKRKRMSSKILETFYFTRCTYPMPYFFWWGIDSLFNALSDRSFFLCLVAEKH